MKTLRIGICGTTHRTVQCAEALRLDDRFSIAWVVTPPPKAVGRKQTVTPNPVHAWADLHAVEVLHVEKKLVEIRAHIEQKQQNEPIDYLLVVDFGYMVPPWLISLPTIAPINIHPSDLPKYRGSSPGQFALLYGETESAVAIMRLVWELDAGPIITRLPFAVDPRETQTSYYQKGFALAAEALPATLVGYSVVREEIPQPADSPTPIAARFSKQDGFVPWAMVQAAQDEKHSESTISITDELSPLMREIQTSQSLSAGVLLDRMVRALSPWPGVWTVVPDYKGRTNVRMKILECAWDEATQTCQPTVVQYEGETVKIV